MSSIGVFKFTIKRFVLMGDLTCEVKVTLKADANLDVDLLHCGYESCVKGFKSMQFIREYHTIHFIISGKLRFISADKTYQLTKGDLFIIFPYANVRYVEDVSDEPLKFCWFSFIGTSSKIYAAKLGFTKNNEVMQTRLITKISGSIIALSDMLTGDQIPPKSFILMKLYELFYLIESSSTDHNNAITVNARDSLSQQIIDYISFNFWEELNVDSITKRFNVSRSYVWRIIKTATGHSPQDFILRTRIYHAFNLLINTDHPVRAIAQSVGINNTTYFYRAFKKITGMTPKQYRYIKAEKN